MFTQKFCVDVTEQLERTTSFYGVAAESEEEAIKHVEFELNQENDSDRFQVVSRRVTYSVIRE